MALPSIETLTEFWKNNPSTWTGFGGRRTQPAPTNPGVIASPNLPPPIPPGPGVIASPNPTGGGGIVPGLGGGIIGSPNLPPGGGGIIASPNLPPPVGGGGIVASPNLPPPGGIAGSPNLPSGTSNQGTNQIPTDPFAYFGGTSPYGNYAAQVAGGYDPAQLPRLRIPSLQTWARMGPQFQQQYFGYRQAQTGAIPEQSFSNIMRIAPPSGQRQLNYRR